MKEKIREWLPYIVILLVVLLVRMFVFSTIRVHGDSMYKTLHDGDIMILNKINYHISSIDRFDIVVVGTDESKIIKRVIGLPGEVVSYKDNVLYIDGKEVKDRYNDIVQDDFEVVLEDNEYFVMGDNRSNSLDSRIIGPITKNRILGQATFTIFPFDRWGNAK